MGRRAAAVHVEADRTSLRAANRRQNGNREDDRLAEHRGIQARNQTCCSCRCVYGLAPSSRTATREVRVATIARDDRMCSGVQGGRAGCKPSETAGNTGTANLRAGVEERNRAGRRSAEGRRYTSRESERLAVRRWVRARSDRGGRGSLVDGLCQGCGSTWQKVVIAAVRCSDRVGADQQRADRELEHTVRWQRRASERT